jgi:Tol biopolymer transport system component
MNPRLVRAGLAVGIIALVATTPRAQVTTAEALFREALAKERAEGALKDAVFGYERIIAEYAADRQAAGKAMYQLALIYEKQNDPRATVLLTRLARDYSTVEPVASRAKARLSARQSDNPSPFPSVEIDKDYELGSPDGKQVIYHKSPDDWGRLYVKELATGKERLLIDEGGASVSNIAWSPDSRRLVYNFVSADNKVNDIRIAAIDGESRSLGVPGYPTAWTAAGDVLFYYPIYKEGLVAWSLVPAAGGAPRQVLTIPTGGKDSAVVMLPDGLRCIISKSKKLYVHDMKSEQSAALTTGTWEESRAQVSADGRLVAFQANPDGRWGLFVAALDGALPVTKPLRLTGLEEPTLQWSGWIGRSWWTAAGVLTFHIEHTRSDLYRIEMDPRTGRAVERPVRLTQDASDNLLPTVSPDGRRVAYWARSGTKDGLSVMDADGPNERRLVEQSLILPVSWRSPSEIVYRRHRPGDTGAMPVVSLNLDTGVEQELARPEGIYWWFNAEKREVLHLYPGAGGARAGAALKAWSLADGKDRVVAQIDFLASQLALTRDGRRIAYTVHRPVEGTAARTAEVGVLSLDSGSRDVLVPAQQDPVAPSVWSPDGRYLLYGSVAKGLRVMDLESRESWPLCRDDSDAEFCKGFDVKASWAPTGAFIVVGRREPPRVERLAWEGVTADAVARLMRRR